MLAWADNWWVLKGGFKEGRETFCTTCVWVSIEIRTIKVALLTAHAPLPSASMLVCAVAELNQYCQYLPRREVPDLLLLPWEMYTNDVDEVQLDLTSRDFT